MDKRKNNVNKIYTIPDKSSLELNSSTTNNDSKFFNKFDIFVLSAILIYTILYYLTYIDTVSWHLSAIGRMLLIRVLPFYDWRPLKNKHCLIEKSHVLPKAIYDCGMCENIRRIDVFETISEDRLEDFINLDKPTILTSALKTWPKDSKFLETLVTNEDFYYSYPCKLSTNIIKDFSYLGEVLERVSVFDEFYLHFQNCDLEAMRRMRKYTYRPEVIPKNFSPTIYNWLIWNKSYNVTNFKPLELVEKLGVFGQIMGTTKIQLVPKYCESVCPIMSILLYGGEALIFTDAWDLEYRPGETGENMAVVMEIRE